MSASGFCIFSDLSSGYDHLPNKSDQKRECGLECNFDTCLMDFDFQNDFRMLSKTDQKSILKFDRSLDGFGDGRGGATSAGTI